MYFIWKKTDPIEQDLLFLIKHYNLYASSDYSTGIQTPWSLYSHQIDYLCSDLVNISINPEAIHTPTKEKFMEAWTLKTLGLSIEEIRETLQEGN